MHLLAKSFEALGIACVLMGLVQGINSPTLWVELWLSIVGIVLFLIGRGIERILSRRSQVKGKRVEDRTSH